MANFKSQFSYLFRHKILIILIAFGIGGFCACLAQVAEPFSKDGSFVYGNFVEKKSNFSLLGNDSLLAQVEVDSEMKCKELCTTNPQCLSVNYGVNRSNVEKVQCEMFSYGRTDYQDHLVPKTGFTHLRLKTACTNDPCFSGIACNPVLGNPARDHSCICRHSDNTNVQYCDSGDIKCNALGMEGSRILDSQITSSSDHPAGYLRTYARLNYGNMWIPATMSNSWIMIDLLKSTTILAVATQGRYDGAGYYISTYEVHYRVNDSAAFTAYQENGVAKVFIGNSNPTDVVKHDLKVPFVAKAVRFLPKTWNSETAAWRLELYGCYN